MIRVSRNFPVSAAEPIDVEEGDLGEVEAARGALAGTVAEEDAAADELDGGVAVPAAGPLTLTRRVRHHNGSHGRKRAAWPR